MRKWKRQVVLPQVTEGVSEGDVECNLINYWPLGAWDSGVTANKTE